MKAEEGFILEKHRDEMAAQAAYIAQLEAMVINQSRTLANLTGLVEDLQDRLRTMELHNPSKRNGVF